MWYYGAGENGPFPNEGAGGVSKDCDLIKKCVTGVELDDGVGDALLFGDCGDENTMKANVRDHDDSMLKNDSYEEQHYLSGCPPQNIPSATTDILCYSDTLRTSEKCRCTERFAYCDAFLVTWDLPKLSL